MCLKLKGARRRGDDNSDSAWLFGQKGISREDRVKLVSYT